jgi:hypothetical protein
MPGRKFGGLQLSIQTVRTVGALVLFDISRPVSAWQDVLVQMERVARIICALDLAKSWQVGAVG